MTFWSRGSPALTLRTSESSLSLRTVCITRHQWDSGAPRGSNGERGSIVCLQWQRGGINSINKSLILCPTEKKNTYAHSRQIILIYNVYSHFVPRSSVTLLNQCYELVLQLFLTSIVQYTLHPRTREGMGKQPGRGRESTRTRDDVSFPGRIHAQVTCSRCARSGKIWSP